MTLTSSASWTWATINFKKGVPTPETLVMYFESKEQGFIFKAAFEKCQLMLKKSQEALLTSSNNGNIFKGACYLHCLENESSTCIKTQWTFVGAGLSIFSDTETGCLRALVRAVDGGNEMLLCDNITSVSVDKVKRYILKRLKRNMYNNLFCDIIQINGSECRWQVTSTNKSTGVASRQTFLAQFPLPEIALEFQSSLESSTYYDR